MATIKVTVSLLLTLLFMCPNVICPPKYGFEPHRIVKTSNIGEEAFSERDAPIVNKYCDQFKHDASKFNLCLEIQECLAQYQKSATEYKGLPVMDNAYFGRHFTCTLESIVRFNTRNAVLESRKPPKPPRRRPPSRFKVKTNRKTNSTTA